VSSAVMRRVKVSELTGPALDWAVAKCEGYDAKIFGGVVWIDTKRTFGVSWMNCGPIIERDRINLDYNHADVNWRGLVWLGDTGDTEAALGPTPLIAAMRCYVASKLGDEVEIPEELL